MYQEVEGYPSAEAWNLYYAQSVSLTPFLVEQGNPEQFVSFVRSAQRKGVEIQGLRITIAKLGYMGSLVSRANPNFCRTVLRLSDSVVTNTAHLCLRNII